MKTWTWIVEALARPEAGTSLALFRIGVGLTVFGELFLTWIRGVVPVIWHTRAEGGYRPSLPHSHWVWDLVGGADAATVDAVFGLTCLAALLITVGLGTRVAAPIALFGIQALFQLSSGSGGGHDRMFQISLFVLTFAGSEATLSVWARIRHGSFVTQQTVTAWPRILITWNLTLIYVSAGIVKLAAEWLPVGRFRAVYNMLLTPYWARADWSWWVGPLFPLTQLGTIVTVVWEMSWFVVPIWLVVRSRERTGLAARFAAVDVRSIYVFVGLVMHGTLWVFGNLGPFSPITMAWYAVLYTPDEYASAWLRLRRLPGQQPQPSV